MYFPISHSHINPIYLVVTGFVVGLLGGFFGVGGSFIAGPALRAMGLDWNFAVGTDLAHIVGKSVVAAKRHRALGNVNFIVSVVSIAAYLSISAFMLWESWRTLAKSNRSKLRKRSGTATIKADQSAFMHVTKALQQLRIWPMIRLPTSGVTISFWIIVLVSFIGGLFSGFLGGGAGYIRMPSLVYVLGIPTHLAVGTDLFEIIISAGYGTFTHAIKGNVDILIALVMHTGAAIGAQIGAIATQYFAGPKIRLAFVPLPLIGAAIVIYTLLSGHKL